jgi:tetratricopeptide (TPR) repeat protein
MGTSARALPLDPTESVRRTNRIEEARQFLDRSIHSRDNGWTLKAKRFAARALAILERERGAYHEDVVRGLLCLAGVREDLADYTRAEAGYRRANDILNLMDGLCNHADRRGVQRLRIQALRGLANVLGALGRDRQAETLLKEALAMAERTFGPTDGDVATALNDLGAHARHTGAYEESSRLHHRALAIVEPVPGAESAKTAGILHQLGVLEQARGRCAVGEGFARRSADLRQKAWGPSHPRVAAELALLAALFERQGKREEAASAYGRALLIVERWFGSDYREVATTGDLAGIVDRARGERTTRFRRHPLSNVARCEASDNPATTQSLT